MSDSESRTTTEPESGTCCQHEPASASEAAPSNGVGRRTVLAAAGAVGAAGLLAACSSSDSSTSSSATDSGSSAEPDTTTDVPTDTPALANTSDVPVGGATFVESKGIVVAQPSEGEFKAFDARCPHQGCMVSSTQGSDLLCPCHASLFSATTGDVLRGPASRGLDAVQIQVNGDSIVTT